MKILALTVPGEVPISAPAGVPTTSGDPLQTGGALTIKFAISMLFSVGIILSLGYFIYGGYQFMTSEGDPEKTATARKTIIYSIVGLTIIFCSYVVMKLIGSFFGIDFLTL